MKYPTDTFIARMVSIFVLIAAFERIFIANLMIFRMKDIFK